jgi:AmmeMemoRadiSam system protein B/AmmeMemoRadiSam system protein A
VAAELVRQPAVAGTFYPGVRGPLEEVVDGFLREAASAGRPSGRAPKAIVAPHAGYVYSGPVAASAYRTLSEARERITRVVLLGPSHQVPLRGLATTSTDAFLTPLGAIPIDRAARDRALKLPQVTVNDEAHAYEHSLEVQLPFLQRTLADFELVPFSVGDASADEVSELLELLWGGPETLIVVSSDLSHYHGYDTARRLDAATTRAIEDLHPEALDRESACGRVPVRGLLLCAKRHALEVETLDLRNSGDTAGPKDRVVGYGSWAFRPPAHAGEALDDPFDEVLLDVARRSIACGVDAAGPLRVDPADFPEPLREIRSTFVTLRQDGRLRGCIGALEATLSLVEDVARSSWRAAYQDPRFAPVTLAERDDLELHISVLGPSEPMLFRTQEDLLRQLRPGVDGLILCDGTARATFLPEVWESLPEPREFLLQLKRKAGLSHEHWSDSLEVSRYTTRSVG